MQQHPIPQNIMDVEFKLVGDLTLKQFVYLMVGFALSIFVFTSNLTSYVKWPLIVIFGLLGLAFAFVPIDDRSIDIWLFNFFKSIYQPQRRIWIREPHLPDYLTLDLHATPKKSKGKEPADHRLEKFLAERTEEERISPTEEARLLQINAMLKNAMPAAKVARPPISIPQTQIPTLERKAVEKERATLAGKINYSNEPIPIISGGTKYFRTPVVNVTPNRKAAPPGMPFNIGGISTPPRIVRRVVPATKTAVELQPETAKEAADWNENLLKEIKGVMQALYKYNTAGPRPIVDILGAHPQTQPVKPGAITTLRQAQAKKIPQMQIPTPPAAQVPQLPHIETISTLKDQNAQILAELEHTRKSIQRLQTQGTSAPQPQTIVQESKPQIPVTPPVTPLVTPEIKPSAELENKLIKEKTAIKTAAPVPKPIASELNKSMKPNLAQGKVYGRKKELIPGAVVLIKDAEGNPQWAVKTNNAGEFKMSNPLETGRYILEVVSPNLVFDPVQFEVAGSVILPFVVMAK